MNISQSVTSQLSLIVVKQQLIILKKQSIQQVLQLQLIINFKGGKSVKFLHKRYMSNL
jgi:hypothetical protein